MLVNGLRRSNFHRCANIRQIFHRSLVNVSNCLEKAFDDEAMDLQHSDCGVTHDVVGSAQKSLVDASEVGK